MSFIDIVSDQNLKSAIDSLPIYMSKNTYVGWVNINKGAQLKVVWNNTESLVVYIDINPSRLFENHFIARDALHKKAFQKFMPKSSTPYVQDGNGWRKERHTFTSPKFISVRDIASIAEGMCINFSVIYHQDCIEARPSFEIMGIPLEEGEIGKKWENGILYPCFNNKDMFF